MTKLSEMEKCENAIFRWLNRPLTTIIIYESAFFNNALFILKLRAEERDLGEISLETTVLGNHLGVAVRQFAFGVTQPDGSFCSLGTVKLPEAGNDFILVFVYLEPETEKPAYRAVSLLAAE